LTRSWAYESGCCGGDSGKTIFRAKATFFGQKTAAKNEKKIFFGIHYTKKTEFIPSSEIKCPKSVISTNNYWVGRVGQSNFASYHSSFFRALSKNFSGKDGSEKIGSYAYGHA